YVWSTVDIASHLLKCSTIDVPSTLSDHSIVILKCENFLDIKQNKRKIPLKKTFNFDKMTTELWIQFIIDDNWTSNVKRFYIIMEEFHFQFVQLPPLPSIALVQSLISYVDQILAAIF
ncbi:7627_t:CDS:2, partial [Funneliformis geosporum]